MGWVGVHGAIKMSEARKLLPPASCKRCAHWLSVLIAWGTKYWGFDKKCSRCGIHNQVVLKAHEDYTRRIVQDEQIRRHDACEG